MTKPRRILVVGAGFSGLSLSYWAVKNGLEVELIEEKSEVGGLLQSRRVDGNLVESAANGFLWDDNFAELEEDLGIRFIGTKPQSRHRFIFRGGKFLRWPLSFFETVGLIFRFALRFRQRRPHPQESISAWGERMLGPKACTFLLETALQGIYAGVPSRMSATLILGRFFGASKRASRKSKRVGTHSHAEGMGGLVRDLRRYLKKSGRCEIRVNESFGPEDLAKARTLSKPVYLAVPPYRAAEILSQLSPSVATSLGAIEVRAVATATTFWEAEVGEQGMPKGFGALFPRCEGIQAMGLLRNHHIFEGRSRQVSETWLYSGDDLKACGIWDNPEALRELICSERLRISGMKLAPLGFECYFWNRAIPHYTLDLEKFLSQDEVQKLRTGAGVDVFGNFMGSLGLARLFGEARRRIEGVC